MAKDKKDLNVPLSQDLLKKILPRLGPDEDISLLLEGLLQKELDERLSLDEIEPIQGLALEQCFPDISEKLPLKPQYSDLKHIDREAVIVLLQGCEYLDKDSIEQIPKELQSVMEYDIMSSHWYPRDDWEELINDYLDNGSHTTLDSWIEVRKQGQLEDEAAMWVELSRRSLDDH
ncbi:hypothetical protein PQO01_20885 [Lentisphaera marina]|uniref:hypothetical protein n=1 Tax=Lentisphaera marina TaxID=1111041 RepID=UPI002366572A|nr:hypothetical protein [Lentisphaera marina]MDD7987415.1 hypothetical protein [Lentisphaera marina]